jgi:hypothetical protein
MRTTISAAHLIFVATDIIVIERNPEFADYSNPNGEVYGYRADVIAEAPDGSRWVYSHKSWTVRWEREAIEQAEPFRAKVAHSLRNGTPLNAAHWDAIQPAYGSPAYQQGGYEADYARQERERALHEEGFWA